MTNTTIQPIRTLRSGILRARPSSSASAEDIDSTFRICGRIDGWDCNRKCVIEVKSRVNELCDQCPHHEKIQLHAYMVLTRTRRSVLVEDLNGRQKHYEVEFDADLWNTTRASLHEIAHWIYYVCKNKRMLPGSKLNSVVLEYFTRGTGPLPLRK